MKTITLPLIAATLALGLSACNQKTENTADSVVNTTETTATEIGNGIGNLASDVGNAAGNAVDSLTPRSSGQQFVDKAAASDAFEIAAAKLALDSAQSPKVQNFARAMIAAHSESTAKIKAAATHATPAITPDPTMTSDQKDKLADLSKLKGAEFDGKYVSGQIDAHEDALSLMEDYGASGDVASLKAAAKEIVPVVRKHLDMAKALKD